MSNVEQNPKANTPDQDSDDEAVSLFAQLASEDSKDSTAADESNQLDNEQHGDTKPEVDANTEQNSQGQADEDPWATAPEPLRNQFVQLQQNYQKLESDHRANAGRVAALNRKTLELQELLAKNEKANGGAASEQSGVPTAEDLEGKTFAEVEAEWPDVAKFIRSQVSAVQQQVEQSLGPMKELLSEREEQQQMQFIQTEISRLAQAHPDFEQISGDPAFTQWVSKQPAAIQQMYDSQLAEDNIALLTFYKSVTGKTAAVKPVPPKTELSEHAEIPRKGGGRAAVDPNSLDPVTLFNQIAKS